MNARIKDMLPNPYAVDYQTDPHLDIYTEAQMIAFAERIVKDCLGVYDAIDNGNKVEGTDQFPIAVYKRFGLKK